MSTLDNMFAVKAFLENKGFDYLLAMFADNSWKYIFSQARQKKRWKLLY